MPIKPFKIRVNNVTLFVEARVSYSVEEELPLGVPPAKKWNIRLEHIYVNDCDIKGFLKDDIADIITKEIIRQSSEV